ncbi:YihY/virulence factor BrkB family protein [Wansuia hejianensis]|uniref:YihY/virulence factor BrkB family protein n=1 Tax=Wansuia hejianensis TaxID=2763667 RepID=A0A926F1A3_9FIRM|nr:YihY/virulence factor BrkB family protein [Wansuia hejianensis]
MISIENFIKKLTKLRPIIFVDQLLYRVKEDGVMATGTQLSFFLILSLFPFIIVFLNVLSYTSLVRQDILGELIYYLPLETQKIIISFAKEIAKTSSQGLLSIAAILGIWSASSGIAPVIKAINRAYDYEESRSYFRLKFMSIFFTIALIVLLTLVFFTLVFGEIVGRRIFSIVGKTQLFTSLWDYMRIIIPIFYMVFIFALLYKFSPCTSKIDPVPLSATLPGAIFTTLGWMITSIFFSYYVNNFGRFAITYGSLVGIILLLIWLYISSIIIVLGGEINATLQYFNIYGYKWHPEKSILTKYIK